MEALPGPKDMFLRAQRSPTQRPWPWRPVGAEAIAGGSQLRESMAFELFATHAHKEVAVAAAA